MIYNNYIHSLGIILLLFQLIKQQINLLINYVCTFKYNTHYCIEKLLILFFYATRGFFFITM